MCWLDWIYWLDLLFCCFFCDYWIFLSISYTMLSSSLKFSSLLLFKGSSVCAYIFRWLFSLSIDCLYSNLSSLCSKAATFIPSSYDMVWEPLTLCPFFGDEILLWLYYASGLYFWSRLFYKLPTSRKSLLSGGCTSERWTAWVVMWLS